MPKAIPQNIEKTKELLLSVKPIAGNLQDKVKSCIMLPNIADLDILTEAPIGEWNK